MSPEQACGEPVGPPSDIYSLACVVFEMLAGQPPFEATSSESLIRLHVSAAPRAIETLCPTVPSAVARVLERALAKRPQDRYASAVQFAEALAAAASGGSTATPAPAGESLPGHNLPGHRTHFIGRERELAECARLLGDTRVLTLTGIGGCGKTRLAMKLGEHLLPSFPGGVWFVDLAPVAEGSRVVDAVAGGLQVREAAGKELMQSVGEHLAGRRTLIILDNCEHLLGDVSVVADRLLEADSELRLLVTSREGLGIDGERLFPLRSLSIPSVQSSPMRLPFASSSPSGSSSIARSGSSATSTSRRRTPLASPRSAAGSTAFRSRSSSPPRASRCSRWIRSASASTIASAC